MELGAGHLVEPAGQPAVVPREVDGLGDLRITLVERLAGLGGRHLEQVRSVRLEGIGHGAQHALPLGSGQARPGIARRNGLPDGGLHLVR